MIILLSFDQNGCSLVTYDVLSFAFTRGRFSFLAKVTIVCLFVFSASLLAVFVVIFTSFVVQGALSNL